MPKDLRYTAIVYRSAGSIPIRVSYANQPDGNLFGALPLGAHHPPGTPIGTIYRTDGGDPWEHAIFTLPTRDYVVVRSHPPLCTGRTPDNHLAYYEFGEAVIQETPDHGAWRLHFCGVPDTVFRCHADALAWLIEYANGPRIVIRISGGLVQSVHADRQTSVLVIDDDTEGADLEQLTAMPSGEMRVISMPAVEVNPSQVMSDFAVAHLTSDS